MGEPDEERGIRRDRRSGVDAGDGEVEDAAPEAREGGEIQRLAKAEDFGEAAEQDLEQAVLGAEILVRMISEVIAGPDSTE